MPQYSVDVRPKVSDSGAVERPDPNQEVINDSPNLQRETDEDIGEGFDSIPF